MLPAHTLVVFAAVVAGFIAMPGPSNLYVVARGLQGGRRAGVASAFGCATGTLVYVAATAVGLSALIASSRLALGALHYAGAAYLCWLGATALRTGRPRSAARSGASSRVYRQGVIVEVGNPKVALFFLALFPQFLAPAQGDTALQVVVLGAIYVAIGLAGDCLYALGSGSVGRRLGGSRRERRAMSALYFGLAGWAAVSGPT